MKIIISQNGEQFISISEQNIFVDIVPIPVDEEKKIVIYSLGIDSISFGTYKTKTRTKEIFRELISFIMGEIICYNRHIFEMPADTD